MSEVQLSNEIEELKSAYGTVLTTTAADKRQVILIETVALPKGCKPATTSVLLILQAGRPLIYVKPGIKVPNGVDPRSTSIVSVEGKEWLQFSYTFTWGEETHTLLQFVEASLRRFEKLE